MSTSEALVATSGAPHVRAPGDLRRVMRTVLLALIPCLVFGTYNVGYQALLAVDDAAPPADWRHALLADPGAPLSVSSPGDCLLLGALHVVPLLLISLAVGTLWEHAFAVIRRRRRTPGMAVTAVIFTACLPPALAWWQAAFGISVAVVIGREIFGGTGRNLFNPAVIGLAFLAFAYPDDMRDADLWSELHRALAGGTSALAEHGTTWMQAFIGRVPGSVAATSTLGCVLGALLLVQQGVASWRVIVGVLLGALLTGTLFDDGPPASWHLVLGLLAFGAVFLATDPVTSASTQLGRWIYGLLVGFLVVLIRVANPVQTEGVLLAILLGNCFAPLIDHGVIRLHVWRRRRRLEYP